MKLADFGLAKYVVRPIFTVCGTPTYVAPEILSEKGKFYAFALWNSGSLTNQYFIFSISYFSIRNSPKSQRVGAKLALGF